MKKRRLIAELVALALLIVLPSAYPAQAQTPDAGVELPKVALIGDSIRLGYAPLVAKRLAGRARIISPAANGGDSANALRNLDEWVIGEKPVLVHFNCGLHDLKLGKASRQHQVSLEQYESNLKRIVERLRQETSASIVFASTTPILDERHAKRGADFDRFESDVKRYNAAAFAVMKRAGVVAHDLHWVVEQGGLEQLLDKDGTHYTPAGYERLAEAVADCILRQLSVLRYKPLPTPPAGAEAAVAYRKAEVERDALVPPNYRINVPEFRAPSSEGEWRSRRPEACLHAADARGDARLVRLLVEITSRHFRSSQCWWPPSHTAAPKAIRVKARIELLRLLLLSFLC